MSVIPEHLFGKMWRFHNIILKINVIYKSREEFTFMGTHEIIS